MDHLWLQFYPYRLVTVANGNNTISVKVTNYLNSPSKFKITLKSSENIVCNEKTKDFTIGANSSTTVPFTIKFVPKDKYVKREVICADITMNDTYLGEYAEMIVDMH
jgi:hypothetical protein